MIWLVCQRTLPRGDLGEFSAETAEDAEELNTARLMVLREFVIALLRLADARYAASASASAPLAAGVSVGGHNDGHSNNTLADRLDRLFSEDIIPAFGAELRADAAFDEAVSAPRVRAILDKWSSRGLRTMFDALCAAQAPIAGTTKHRRTLTLPSLLAFFKSHALIDETVSVDNVTYFFVLANHADVGELFGDHSAESAEGVTAAEMLEDTPSVLTYAEYVRVLALLCDARAEGNANGAARSPFEDEVDAFVGTLVKKYFEPQGGESARFGPR